MVHYTAIRSDNAMEQIILNHKLIKTLHVAGLMEIMWSRSQILD